MELWGWLVGYVALFALLHLLLYYVYIRRESGEHTTTPSFADPNRPQSPSTPGPDRYPRSTDDHTNPDDHAHAPDGETIRCRQCGAENAADQTYTYCWNCVSVLRQ